MGVYVKWIEENVLKSKESELKEAKELLQESYKKGFTDGSLDILKNINS